MVTVILDEADLPLGEAWVELMGLPELGKGERPLAETMETELTEYLDGAGKKMLANDDKLNEALRKIVRQVAMEEIGKKPEVMVVVSRLAVE
jgi:ribonuclease J